MFDCLSKLPGLNPRKPYGAMYMMVGIDLKKFPVVKTDLEFVQLLIKEKSVFCLTASVSFSLMFINFCNLMSFEHKQKRCLNVQITFALF